MKKIPALTIGALFLFNITTQMAFGQQSGQSNGDNQKHHKNDHSDHSNGGRDNRGGGGNRGGGNHSNNAFSAPREHSSSSRHHSNNGNPAHFEAPKRDAHISTPKHQSFTREVTAPVQSRVRDHASQNRDLRDNRVNNNNRDNRVNITSRRSSSSHSNRFSVSSTRYNTFISSGWRHHRGWDRDDRGHFFYNHNRIFFSIIGGVYYPYYLNGQTPVYISYSSNDSDTVASVQQALANAGYYNGAIDGEFGPMTSQSIAAYQNDHGLTPTGQINGALIDSLGLD